MKVFKKTFIRCVDTDYELYEIIIEHPGKGAYEIRRFDHAIPIKLSDNIKGHAEDHH